MQWCKLLVDVEAARIGPAHAHGDAFVLFRDHEMSREKEAQVEVV